MCNLCFVNSTYFYVHQYVDKDMYIYNLLYL